MSAWDHPLYGTWRAMLTRCYSAKHQAFARYGGRGIAVCAGWRSGLAAFVLDVGERPDGHTIDRLDNDKGYFCGRCSECSLLGREKNWRWATALEQRRNTSRVALLTVSGETMPLADWARRAGLHYETLYGRLARGWTPELAVTVPATIANAARIRARNAGVVEVASFDLSRCIHGHEMTPENTYDGPRQRSCRTCRRHYDLSDKARRRVPA